jgi:hypothetical protein
MQIKQVSKRLVISGAIIIWVIKYFIRPLQFFEEPFRFFLNIAPNLFGSFLVPFAVYWFFNGRSFRMSKVFRIETPYQLSLVCLIGFGMLVINEYLQQIPFFGRTFDISDILFSALGLLVSYFVFSGLLFRKQKGYLHEKISF